ncbi:hypothetical protein [Paludisphaera rhizosphaerae]|uniref:hypothetical protein n=1 Tax=Paludisphaera rhizosphaerae TaxID=2711216 RepID=UPI0013EE0240|nr:hypothetical protein [Paludisphaera rhizosphaerae]
MSPSEAYEAEAAVVWRRVVDEISTRYPDVEIYAGIDDHNGVKGYARIIYRSGPTPIRSEVEVGCGCTRDWMVRIMTKAVEDLRRQPIEVQPPTTSTKAIRRQQPF